MSITIGILKLGLINFSRLVIKITDANLRLFQYVDINQCVLNLRQIASDD